MPASWIIYAKITERQKTKVRLLLTRIKLTRDNEEPTPPIISLCLGTKIVKNGLKIVVFMQWVKSKS